MSLQEQYQDFAENLQEQCCAGEARRMRLREEKLSRMKRMRESILHPFKDPEGLYQRIKRPAKYATAGGVVGGVVGKLSGHGYAKGAATGAVIGGGVGHLVNQLPYASKESEHVAKHLGHAGREGSHIAGHAGGVIGNTKRAFKKAYHGEK